PGNRSTKRGEEKELRQRVGEGMVAKEGLGVRAVEENQADFGYGRRRPQKGFDGGGDDRGRLFAGGTGGAGGDCGGGGWVELGVDGKAMDGSWCGAASGSELR